MEFIKVASLSQLEPDSVMEVVVAGNAYAICNVSGNIYALSGVCPHRGGPLGQGEISGRNLVCPWHGWEWDCRTGENSFDAADRVPRFEVKVAGQDILLQAL